MGDTILPAAFAVPGAGGDALAVVLAFAAIVALRMQLRGALTLVWIFNIVGIADFVVAFTQGLRVDIAQQYQLGPTWFIPTFFVPAFFVTHLIIFRLLLAHTHQPHAQLTPHPLDHRLNHRPAMGKGVFV